MTFHSHADGPVAHAAYRLAVLHLGPDHPDTLNLRGLVELRQGEARRALATIKRGLKAAPRSGALWQCYGWIMHELGESVESLAAYRRAVDLQPDVFELWPSLIWALDISEHTTGVHRLAVRAEVERRFCAPLARTALPHTNDPDPDRPLRLGYISADFFKHSAAFTFSLPLRHHDRSQFEVYCYDSREWPADAMTSQLKDAADHWRTVVTMDDDTLAATIRDDRIDVLVDLSGVTSGGRLMAMARKPAPVQITAWGYAPGLGLSYIDYLLSDRVVIPPEHADRYLEEILYLPALMAADIEVAGDATPDILPRPADRPPTFGYFGRVMKITDTMLATWAQILNAVPDSRLIFKMMDCKDPIRQDRIIGMFTGLGIAADRIEMRGETSRADHLAQHNDLDVCLDTSPVGGGTTTLDACLMGVPTVTLLGDTVPGRISASILTAIDEEISITTSFEEYVQLAVLHATPDRPMRRQHRRDAFLDSIMCDADRYTRAVEGQYRVAWQAWCVNRQMPASERSPDGWRERAGFTENVFDIAGEAVV